MDSQEPAKSAVAEAEVAKEVKTETAPEEAVKTSVPKQNPNKKTTTIIIVVVAALLLLGVCCAFGAIFFASKVMQNSNSSPTSIPTVTISLTPSVTATLTPSSQVTPSPTSAYNPNNVQISFLSQPQLQTTKVKLYVDTTMEPDDPKIYKVGTIKSGTLHSEESGKSLDLSGQDLFLSAFTEATLYDGIYGPFYAYVHFIVKNGEKYILDDKNQPYYSASGLNTGVSVDFSLLDFEAWALPQTFRGDYGAPKITSNKGISYEQYVLYEPIPFDNDDLVAVDSIAGITIYKSKAKHIDETYIKTNDGFRARLNSDPTLNGGTDVPQITWNDGTTNKSSYSYVSIGSCMENYLEVVASIPDSNITGYDKLGNPIYEAKDNNESYRLGLYNADYIQGEVYKYNSITDDDSTPYTVSQYLAHHPVFYWKDEYDRYVRFANDEFIFAGGCGKPVIYLHPTTTTDISVKVIPNGRLTLDVPRMDANNTWNVTATKDSVITDKATGKSYGYLWWESQGAENVIVPKSGFVLSAKNLDSELGTLLVKMGFTASEKQAFLDYWLPIMEKDAKPYYFVTFLQNEQVDQIARLEFSLKPDHVNRVFMVFRGLDQKEAVTPLALQQIDRSGFYVLEWGGSKD